MVTCLSRAMPWTEVWAAGFVGLDGLVHERDEGFFKPVRRLSTQTMYLS